MPGTLLLRMPKTPDPKNHNETRLGQLIRAAIKAKTEELQATGMPGTYSYRMLAKDAGYDFTYVGKLIHGQQQPSEDIVLATVRALSPYLSADQALIAAGYAPRSRRLKRMLRRLVHIPSDQLEMLDQMIMNVYVRSNPNSAPSSDEETLYTFLEKPRTERARKRRD